MIPNFTDRNQNPSPKIRMSILSLIWVFFMTEKFVWSQPSDMSVSRII